MRIRMDSIKWLFLGSLLALVSTASASGTTIDATKGCRTNPAVVGKCFSVTGRIAVYNGSPVVRISPKGGKRLLGVLPSENEIIPAELKALVNPDQDVFAEMVVCPFTKFTPGRMQLVCIESAEKVKVQKR